MVEMIREYLIFYQVSVTYCDFGVVREFAALLSILQLMAFKLLKTWSFWRVCLQTPSVAVFAQGQAPTRLTSDSVCKGSGDQEPDRPRKSMAGGCDERPRAATSDPELKTMVFIRPVRGLTTFATLKPRVLRGLSDYRLQKCRVFEGSKWILKNCRTRRIL